MHIIVVFLGQSITNKLVVCGTPRIGHGLHQFGTQTPLETLYLFLLSIHKSGAYLDRLLNACIYSMSVFVP